MKDENKNKDGLYICKFEDRIRKDKLPKDLSYVLQTTDITKVLPTDGLSLNYMYVAIKKGKTFSICQIDLLSYSKWGSRWGEPGSLFDYDRRMYIYSVPAKIRKALRAELIANVLSILKNTKGRRFNINVFYKSFYESNYELKDRGGIYIEDTDRLKVIYRNKEFNLDKEIKEYLP